MKELLDDIDALLMYFEDFTHGRDGDKITEMRCRIAGMRIDALLTQITSSETEREKLLNGLSELTRSLNRINNNNPESVLDIDRERLENAKSTLRLYSDGEQIKKS